MSYGPTPEEYPQLPGPARLIRDIVADLSHGKSVVIVFPDALVESGIADAILDDLQTEAARPAFCDGSAEPFPSRVISTFGSDPIAERRFAEWETIVEWDAWLGSWLLVTGWLHQDVAEIVDRWPPQLKACGLPADSRPKLIIAVRLADLPRSTITHIDQGSMSVHWWWGVLDRLDTETRLATTSVRRFNPVDSAVIIEVSGWDLSCTEFLAANWDRTTCGLQEALRQYQEQITTAQQARLPSAPGKMRGVKLPPTELEQFWRDGLVDRWAHSIRLAPSALLEADVNQRQWMAHNRMLIPHVDEERAEYEDLILARASPASLDGLRRRDDDDIIEIGSLAWLVASGRVDIGRERRLRLLAFRNLRNDLAHRRPAADELLGRIINYLQF
ncbi:hypothetical protein MCEMAEM6B_02489 [Mycobacteriaceae bacterium]